MTATVVDAGDGLPLTVPTLLHERASRRGDHALLICDDDVLTYADARSRSAALAKGLLAGGASRGTHVGLLHPNGSAFVVGWLAAAQIGAVAVPLSTFSTSAELRTLLFSADVEVLLASPSFGGRDYAEALREAVPDLDAGLLPPLSALSVPALRRVTFDQDALATDGADVDDEVLAAAEAGVRPSDRMVIVHTSGSNPKGVIHQHGPLIRHLDNLNELRSYTEGEVLFSNSPFFWIDGFAYSLLGTLLGGATLVCSNATDFPATLDMLAMTETGGVCLASDDEGDQPEHRRGSFGRPVPGFEAKVVDPDIGNECDVGQVGELWFRSPFLMEGYYGRERHETFTPDGWFRTGDLFHVDADGRFYFTGRRGVS